jgi:hypothetical protein
LFKAQVGKSGGKIKKNILYPKCPLNLLIVVAENKCLWVDAAVLSAGAQSHDCP